MSAFASSLFVCLLAAEPHVACASMSGTDASVAVMAEPGARSAQMALAEDLEAALAAGQGYAPGLELDWFSTLRSSSTDEAAMGRFSPDPWDGGAPYVVSAYEQALGRMRVLSGLSVAGSAPLEFRLFQFSDAARVVPDDAWAARHDRLDVWAALPQDWDGEDGVAPSPEVLSAARGFLAAAQPVVTPAPDDYIAGDGEIGYVWDTPQGFASISFLSAGRVVGKVRGAGRDTLRFDEPLGVAMDLDTLLQRISEIA